MLILTEKIPKEKLNTLETLGENESFFEDMIKCVVDIERELVAINAELHSDLEKYLLDNRSDNKNLYGINILLDDYEIEFDSLINPPRNREAGFPRVGRDVADPIARENRGGCGQVDRTLRWFEMGIGEQISNIGSEVNRAIKYKNKNDEDKKRRFYEKAVELLELTCADPKNQFRVGELKFCIEELTDYFVGTNQYHTTDAMLMKYYDAFLV